MKRRKSHVSFKFGDGAHNSLGTIPILISIPNGDFLHIDVDVVTPDVPFLIGLDILYQEQLIPNNVAN